MKKAIFSIFLILAIVQTSSSQLVFQRVFGGWGPDYGYSFRQISSKNYITSISTGSYGAGNFDIGLLKTDSIGQVIWGKTYGNSLIQGRSDVITTKDGGYALISTTQASNDFGDLYVVKTDAFGDTMWTKAYGGAGYDNGEKLAETTDGGFILLGATESFGMGGYDVYLIKTNPVGDVMWSKTYGGSSDDLPFSVQQTYDGGYIVIGHTNSYGMGSRDIYLIKTNSIGDTLWTHTYGGSGIDVAWSGKQTSDGGYIITGWTDNVIGPSVGDLILIKTDGNGDIIWSKAYGGSAYDKGEYVDETVDGGFIVTGDCNSFGAGDGDVYLIKTDSNGDTLWTRAYGTDTLDRAYFVKETFTDDSVGYIISARSTGFGDYDLYMIKTDQYGYSGCNVRTTDTKVTDITFQVGSGAVVTTPSTVVKSTQTIVSDMPIGDSLLCAVVGVEEKPVLSKSTLIYPNPSNGVFHVKIKGTIEIYSALGELLLTIANSNEIDLSNFPSGLYYLRAETPGGVVINKIVISR